MSNTRYDDIYYSSTNNSSPDISNNISNISLLIQSLNTYHETIELYNRNVRDILSIIRIEQLNNIARTTTSTRSRTNTNTFAGIRNRTPRVNLNYNIEQSEIYHGITTITYESVLNDTVCPITLEEFVIGESICKINTCGHIFKRAALTQWISSSNQCPVCRSSIISRTYNTSRNYLDMSGNSYADATRNHIVMSNNLYTDTSRNYTDISGNTYTDQVRNRLNTSINTALSQLTFNEILSLFDSNTYPIEYIFDIPIYYDISTNDSSLPFGNIYG